MNIFVLDRCPFKSAEMVCDTHTISQSKESVQLLWNVAHHLGKDIPDQRFKYRVDKRGPKRTSLSWLKTWYKPTHMNHPCSRWARKSYHNYMWLHSHTYALLEQYCIRYGKIHGSTYAYHALPKLGKSDFQSWHLTTFAQAMPEEYQGYSPVEAYRTYYYNDKHELATWERGVSAPNWWYKGDLYEHCA